jgi:hypothetical protein
MAIRLGRHPPRRQAEYPGGDHQRPISSSKRLAEGLDGEVICAGSAWEVPRESKVVLEREMDDRVAPGSGGVQALEVVKGATVHLSPAVMRAAAEASERARPTT